MAGRTRRGQDFAGKAVLTYLGRSGGTRQPELSLTGPQQQPAGPGKSQAARDQRGGEAEPSVVPPQSGVPRAMRLVRRLARCCRGWGFT
ncbi:hypothetical protein GCM10011320_57460 [Neoroseomonas lacus]|uniref:Uncharacterized protein n=1 Tax=Neoroseomonas lacus TaxID=287609 RepID=A0A917L338_9PROT|nr:hypothetical protein GCM10011320_57460 [Neoroseomonas lacus]